MPSKYTAECLNAALRAVEECGINIEKIIAIIADKPDQERMMFWSLYIGDTLGCAVKSIGKETVQLILNNMLEELNKTAINSKFH